MCSCAGFILSPKAGHSDCGDSVFMSSGSAENFAQVTSFHPSNTPLSKWDFLHFADVTLGLSEVVTCPGSQSVLVPGVGVCL